MNDAVKIYCLPGNEYAALGVGFVRWVCVFLKLSNENITRSTNAKQTVHVCSSSEWM